MSSKFATWIHVRPAPTTIAASHALLKHLKTQGRIVTFIRKPTPQSQTDEACYYTVFAPEPPTLRTDFSVSVYHDLPNPRDIDPFNLRGMLDRKPHPKPITLQCRLDVVSEKDMHKQKQWINEQSPYRGHYSTDYKDQPAHLQTLFRDIGAPPGVARSLGDWKRAPGQLPAPVPEVKGPIKARRVKMNALMQSWRQAQDGKKQSEDD